MLEQTRKRMRQHFIGAIADKHLGRRQTVVLRDTAAQRAGGRVRVAAQLVGIQRANRVEHPGGRRVGVFVGVELEQILKRRLLAGRVGFELPGQFAPEALAHARSPATSSWSSAGCIWRTSTPRTR